MTFQVPAKVEVLFGSQTRAKVLGYLAESSLPQTGYAIAKNLEVGVSKVYDELRKLEGCGILVGTLDPRGNRGFLLNDGDLRKFLVKNLRIVLAEEWFSPERTTERRRSFEEARRITIKIPSAPSQGGTKRFSNEFRRPPEKDRALGRVRKARGRPR